MDAHNGLKSFWLVGLICLLGPLVCTQHAAAQVPSIGRSGLPWNAGVFTSNASAEGVAAFEAWRGRPVDSVLWFPARGSGKSSSPMSRPR